MAVKLADITMIARFFYVKGEGYTLVNGWWMITTPKSVIYVEDINEIVDESMKNLGDFIYR